jgi:hypothetical protein
MADYTAWLIEISEGGSVAEGGPVYFQMSNDDDWTPDHDKALHFARKQDAESIIAYYGWNRTKAIEHCWPEPRIREVVAESNGHHWIKAFNLTCCRDCGIVRRADDKNSQCKGSVRVGPRAAPASHATREQLLGVNRFLNKIANLIDDEVTCDPLDDAIKWANEALAIMAILSLSHEAPAQEPVAWGERINGKIVSVRMDRSTHCNEPLYAEREP